MHFQFLKYFFPNFFDLYYTLFALSFKIPLLNVLSISEILFSKFLRFVLHPFCSTIQNTISQCIFNFWNTFFQIPSICNEDIVLFLLYYSRYLSTHFLKYIFPNSLDFPFFQERQKKGFNEGRLIRAGGRHGSDSAVGSSATLSGDQVPSSPPSWASSPPASPDSAVTAVSYIPDQQAVLQRVSFTTSSEVRQVTRSSSSQETSRSTAAPYTPSITSIGGAVLRWGNPDYSAGIGHWMILIRATVLVFERNIWDSSFTLPRESSATYRGAFTLISRHSIARC